MAQFPPDPGVGGVRPSPIFYALVGLTIGSAAFLTTSLGGARVAAFVFVVSAWILSVVFHEFAHAYVAWRSGDRSVEQRGYLTLDPRKYTNPVLSFAIPIFFILIGGIGLPGGAVLINRAALSENQAIAVSLAGPFTNLTLGIATLVPLRFDGVKELTGANLSASLAFFGFLQIIVFVINMLPIPGLDGYAALEPTLPQSTQELMAPVRRYGFLILIVGLFYVAPVRDAFWNLIFFITEDVFGINDGLYATGYELFRFWGDINFL